MLMQGRESACRSPIPAIAAGFLIALTLCVACVAGAGSSGRDDEVRVVQAACRQAFLPTDLDLITTVEQTDVKETHMRGEYRIGHDDYVAHLGGLTRNLTLRYTTQTEFRLAMYPGDASKLALRLYRTGGASGDELVTYSLHGGERIERMVFAVLEANVRYNLVIIYSLGFNADIKCPRVVMEVAAQATSMAVAVANCEGADEELTMPAIRPSSTDSPAYYYEFNSEPKFFYVGKGSATSASDAADSSFSVLSSYPVTVPHIPNHHGKWKFRVVIHANFIDGGDIVAVVTVGNGTVPPTPSKCSDNNSGSTLQCMYGARIAANVFVLQEELWSGVGGQDGQYVLWLVRRKAERSLARTCVPVQLTVQLLPLKDQETFINCDVDPLPETFNTPGLYSNATGVLRFNAAVLVNLTQRAQRARISTTKPKSLLRAWVGNHQTVDVDLVLYHNNRMVAASMAYNGPEGIAFELQQGEEYELAAVTLSAFRKYTPRDHDYYELCDSFELQVHVFPITSSDSEADDRSCTVARGPSVEMQEILNRTGGFTFGLPDGTTPPFTFPLKLSDSTAQQKIFANGLRFYLKQTTFFFALVVADTYGGTPQMTLRIDGSQQIMYSKTRTVGQELYAWLEAGWYTLDVLTPYLQPETTYEKISSVMPLCIRYNFKLRLSPRSACLAPLILPGELTDAAHAHHHLFDEYRVDPSGTHLMSLKQSQGSTLHVKVDWSDAPVTLAVYEGDAGNTDGAAPIATSHTLVPYGDGKPEVFVNLRPNQFYTLQFTFDLSAGAPELCRTFMMQLSLVPTPEPLKVGCDVTRGELDLGLMLPPVDLRSVDVYKPAADISDRKYIVISFELNATAHFRMVADHDFTMHAMSVALCSCKRPSDCRDRCVNSDMYFNGNELPRRTLAPGEYSLEMLPWKWSMVNGRDVESDCALLGIHLVITPIVPRPAPALCPRSMQYLPRTLNKIGMLSPHYGSEAHFLQHVKVNSKHFEDETTFHVGVKSVVRVHVPYTVDGHGGTVTVMNADRTQVLGVSTRGEALYVEAAPGDYVLTIAFAMMWTQVDSSACNYVPVEISIIKSTSVPLLAEAPPGGSVGECRSPNPLPTTMFHHGHETMYRVVGGDSFRHTINFTVAGSNGNVDVDIRSNFPVGGLAARIQGVTIDHDGSEHPVIYLFHHYTDRVFLNTDLPPGRYNLFVHDSVALYRDGVPRVACTPFSFHLRLTGGGAPTLPPATMPNPTPGAPPITVPPTPAPSVRPTLNCPYNQYDTLPRLLALDGQSTWFSIRGRAFEIPFAASRPVSGSVSSRPLYTTSVTTAVRVVEGNYVRVWVHTDANVDTVRLRLYDPTRPHVAAYRGLLFGPGTRSLAVKPDVAGASTTFQLEISFVFGHVPLYPEDYTDCFGKQKLTAYSMYVSVFPATRVTERATCPMIDVPFDVDAPAPGADSSTTTGIYPWPSTSQITLDHEIRLSGQSGFFTRHDCRLQVPRNWQTDQNADSGTTVSMPFIAHTTCLWNVTIDVLPGSVGVFLSFEVKFNLLLSNMRAQLNFPNGSVYKVDRGRPATERDESFNAQTAIHAWGVAPGKYTLILAQSFAQPDAVMSSLAEVCVPFEVAANFGGSKLGSGPAAPDETGPRVVSVTPMPTTSLDPSGPFGITVVTDTPLDIEYRPAGRFPAFIVDNVTGHRVEPVAVTYRSPTRVVVQYSPFALQWYWPYHIELDLSALKVADGSAVTGAFGNAAVLPYYTTAPCSCFDGVCATGGQCRCQEAGGAMCDACPSGTRLSSGTVRLGPERGGHRYARVCQLVETPAPTPAPPHTAQPSPDTPRPGTPPNPTPAPPKDGNTPPTSGPDATPPSSSNGARPPLKWMRVLFSATCLTLFIGFSLFRLHALARRRSRTGTFNNPFRRVAHDEDNAHDAFDVDDDDDDTVPITQASRSAVPSSATATLPPGAARRSTTVDYDDDDANENNAIV